MHHPLEILSLRRPSEARSIEALQHAVRSALADAWHSPAGVHSASKPGHVRTLVGIALDPRLLGHLRGPDAERLTQDLCGWMRSLHVEYTVGYLTQGASLPSGRGVHRLTVALLRCGE